MGEGVTCARRESGVVLGVEFELQAFGVYASCIHKITQAGSLVGDLVDELLELVVIGIGGKRKPGLQAALEDQFVGLDAFGLERLGRLGDGDVVGIVLLIRIGGAEGAAENVFEGIARRG